MGGNGISGRWLSQWDLRPISLQMAVLTSYRSTSEADVFELLMTRDVRRFSAASPTPPLDWLFTILMIIVASV